MTEAEWREREARFWENVYRTTDKDGIPWHEAPLPRRWHRCSVWSLNIFGARCACGACWFEAHWCDRNARRRAS